MSKFRRHSLSYLFAFIIIGCSLSASQAETPLASSKPVRGKVEVPPEKANPVSVGRFETPPVIDGRLDEEVWKSAVVLKDFYQIQPGDNIAPSQKSEVVFGYDAERFYVAFRCFEDQDKVRVTVAKRDAIFSDDYVGLYLDTFHDKRKAYALFFNPLGIQADGIFTEGQGEDYSLDILMESKGLVHPEGFTIEVAIPFKSLRFAAGKDKYWGVHIFRRLQHYNRELDSWMPTSRDISGSLIQAGRITGLVEIATERNLEVIPTFTISQSGRRVRSIPAPVLEANPTLVDRGRFVNSPIEFDPGLNIKFGLTQSLTLDFTANPDFAQVEADQIVITANQRFPIFFPERRPFFLEGIDIFQTSLQAVHTRAIVDPDFAVKLSGKQGRTTIGLLAASDNAPGNFSEEERTDPEILSRIEKFLDKNAQIGVFRLKRDIGAESSLNFLATSYDFIEKHNKLGGIDGRFRVNKQSTMNFQLLGTTSRRFFFDPKLDETLYRTGNGFGYVAGYNYNGRHLNFEVFGNGRSSNYRADVGFTPRTNTNFNSMFIGYNTEPKPRAKLISMHFHKFTHFDYDFQGRSQNWESEFIAEWQFARQTSIGGGYEVGFERLFEEEFGAIRTDKRPGAFFGPDPERSSRKHHFFLFGNTRPVKQFGADYRLVYRDGAFDFDFGAGPKFPRVSPAALADPDAALDPGRGGLWEFNAGVTYQPINELRSSLRYTRNQLRRFDTGRVAFEDNIYSFSTIYQFSRASFARVLLDYTTLSSRVRGQYLFGWTPSPGTSFYAGYNDTADLNGFSPFSFNRVSGYQVRNRTFFLKMSYLFRKSI